MAYEIVSSRIGDDAYVLALAPIGTDTFIEKMMSTPKKQVRAASIVKTMRRIIDNGIEWAFDSETFKPLDSGLALCELRVSGKVIRVMTYLHKGQTPIYLFDFDSHQGKGSGIPENIMEKAESLAKAAKECMEEEEARP